MFKNYFKTAVRDLMRNKFYSFINTFGLAFGMAITILIALYVQHELCFDIYHKDILVISVDLLRFLSR